MRIPYCVRLAQICAAAKRIESRRSIPFGALLSTLLCALGATAQITPGALISSVPPPQFDVTGFIQAATLDGANGAPSICPTVSNPLLKGGTLTVNGVTMVVPCNTIVQMPANTIPFALLFPTVDAAGNVAAYSSPVGTATTGLSGQPISDSTPVSPSVGLTAGVSGLALADSAVGGAAQTPFPSFEVRALGNVVNGTYIVGLIVPISQQNANAGFGQITCIDYANGFMYVGGAMATPTLGSPAVCVPGPAPAGNGFRLQINDPIGRWGRVHSPDPRFSGDVENTTIHAASGYPMCVPRVDPYVSANNVNPDGTPRFDGGDPYCPLGNRPSNGDPRFAPDPFIPAGAPLHIFTMDPPLGVVQGVDIPDGRANLVACAGGLCSAATAASYPDPRQQVPFMIGDWINYAGSLAADAIGQYMSVHTVIANLGIYTTPGTQPSYVSVETILLGTGGIPVAGIDQEITTRIFMVGFSTDFLSLVDINAVDVNPCSGVETLRLLGNADPTAQVVKGRWRMHVLGGAFMPPTREMLIVSETPPTPASDTFDMMPPQFYMGTANGLGSGFYRLPNFDFIFAEGLVAGQPVVPNNFQDLPFLSDGWGLLDDGTVIGQLTPWPGAKAPPAPVCATTPAGTGFAPIAFAGIDRVIVTNSVETFLGTVRQDPNGGPATYLWTQAPGDPDAHLVSADTLNPSWDTLGIPGGTNLTFNLAVTDAFGTTNSLVKVSVVSAATDSLTLPTATFRTQKTALGNGAIHKVGGKGGILKVGVTDSAPDGVNPATVQNKLFVDGWGEMSVDTVTGFPNYILNVPGLSRLNPPPPGVVPATVNIHSSGGGEALNVPVTIK
jgi:hypothetical protein